jgi:serine/threonine-protein kinase
VLPQQPIDRLGEHFEVVGGDVVLEEVFAGFDPSETRGETMTAREILDKGAARVMAKLKDQPETQAALALAIGKVYLSLGLNDRALPLLQQSLAQR